MREAYFIKPCVVLAIKAAQQLRAGFIYTPVLMVDGIGELLEKCNR